MQMKVNIIRMQFIDHAPRHSVYSINDIKMSKRYRIVKDFKGDEEKPPQLVFMTRRLKRTDLKYSKRPIKVINLA